MTVVAALYRDVRSAERHEVALDGTLRNPERRPFDVVVDELSSTGFRVPAATRLEVGSTISLGLPGVGMCSARVVRRMERQYGCEFATPLAPGQLDAALQATAAAPIMLSSPLHRPSLGAADGAPTSGGLSGPVRVAVIAGLAAVSWAGMLTASRLLGG